MSAGTKNGQSCFQNNARAKVETELYVSIFAFHFYMQMLRNPADAQHNNVIIASKRHRNVVLT